MPSDDREKPLLARRIPMDQVEFGRAYVIHARNGGVGVAVGEHGELGYRLHRRKFDRNYLFVELDWDLGAPHGTAIPLALIDETPPEDDEELLAWLAQQEEVHREATREAWDIVLGRR